MKALITILLLVSLSLALPEIGFTSNGWIVDDGITISGDTLTIIGDKSSYRKARMVVSVPATTTDLYLSAGVKLSVIDGGPETHKTAKFKILDGTGTTNVQAFNMSDLIVDRWYTTGMHVGRFDKKGLTEITVEFSIQNAAGTMEVTAPVLSETPPAATYAFPFDIPADPTCRILIETDSVRPFPEHLLSVNSHFVWAGGDWGDMAVRDVIKNRLPLGNLRFPGGTVGNFYDWQSDGFFGDEWTFLSASRKKAYEESFRFGFSDFASLCTETEATATLMFNVIHDSPATAATRLSNRIASGIAIDWIEMGNENFFAEQSYGNIDTPQKYIDHTKALTAALKEVEPSAKTAVNLNHHDWAEGSWNRLLAAENYYDAAVIHPYVQTNTFMMNEYAAKVMLSSYRTTKERLEKYRTWFSETPLLCTEYGVLSESSPSNFIQALGTADLFLGLIEGNDADIVQQMGLHMLYHSDRYSEGTLYFGENGSLKRTRMGVLYEALINFFTGTKLYKHVGTGGELEENLPGVMARAVQDGDTTRILVVNKLPVASPLQIAQDSSVWGGTYSMKWFTEEILGDSTGYGLDEDPWSYRDGMDTPEIPPYSIAIVTLNSGETGISSPKTFSTPVSIRAVRSGIQVDLPLKSSFTMHTPSGRTVVSRRDFRSGIVGENLVPGLYLWQVIGKNGAQSGKVIIR